MSVINDNPRAALRLSRTIASDILLYNREKVKAGLAMGTPFALIEEELAEGRTLYEARVSETLRVRYRFFERALVDQLLYPLLERSEGDSEGEPQRA